jgi:hypothetical protein
VDCDAQHRKTGGDAERSDAFFRAIAKRRPPPPQVRSPSPVTTGEEKSELTPRRRAANFYAALPFISASSVS